MKSCVKYKNGYIALTSAIVISFVIMAVVFAVSFTGFFSRANVLDTYFKEISKFVAESCVETALLRLGTDPTYQGGDILTLNGDECSIMPIDILGLTRIIKTKSTIQEATTNLRVTASFPTLTIVSWEEVESF